LDRCRPAGLPANEIPLALFAFNVGIRSPAAFWVIDRIRSMLV
jgi:hypothetical protein